ncbi:SUKH-3 domain-containing protein [Streptomyces sp. NBC_01565]|nr:SUKH-3 domain-containing protein [Streptomyces sp. NBC_01565]
MTDGPTCFAPPAGPKHSHDVDLREFGGLTVGSRGPGITRAREAFELDPLLALGEDDCFGEWGEEICRCLFPLCELDHGHAFLGVMPVRMADPGY